MNKSSNILLIVVVILLTYLSIVQTAIYYKKEDNQFLQVQSHDMVYGEPILKVDAKTGIIYKLKRTDNGTSWVILK